MSIFRSQQSNQCRVYTYVLLSDLILNLTRFNPFKHSPLILPPTLAKFMLLVFPWGIVGFNHEADLDLVINSPRCWFFCFSRCVCAFTPSIVVAWNFTLVRAASESELWTRLTIGRAFDDVLLPRQSTSINPDDVTPSDVPSEVFFSTDDSSFCNLFYFSAKVNVLSRLMP